MNEFASSFMQAQQIGNSGIQSQMNTLAIMDEINRRKQESDATNALSQYFSGDNSVPSETRQQNALASMAKNKNMHGMEMLSRIFSTMNAGELEKRKESYDTIGGIAYQWHDMYNEKLRETRDPRAAMEYANNALREYTGENSGLSAEVKKHLPANMNPMIAQGLIAHSKVIGELISDKRNEAMITRTRDAAQGALDKVKEQGEATIKAIDEKSKNLREEFDKGMHRLSQAKSDGKEANEAKKTRAIEKADKLITSARAEARMNAKRKFGLPSEENYKNEFKTILSHHVQSRTLSQEQANRAIETEFPSNTVNDNDWATELILTPNK